MGTLSVVGVFGACALAQSASFLEAEAPPGPTGRVTLRLLQGPGGPLTPVPWTTTSVRWAFVKTGEIQENRDSLAEWLKGDGRLETTLPAPGPAVIGVDFAPQTETLPAAELAKLLKGRVPSTGVAVHVRHYRSAAIIVRPNGDAGPSPVPVTETSLTCAVHALIDPSRPTGGGDLAFEVAVRGEEVEDARITVRHVPSGATRVLETNESGLCRFTPESVGEYQLSFQVARPLRGDAEVSFEVFSGTLTFTVPSVKEARS